MAAVLNGELFVVGGYDATNSARTGERYDPVIFGVQPLDVSYGMNLSAPLEDAAVRLVEMILQELSVDASAPLDKKGVEHHD